MLPIRGISERFGSLRIVDPAAEHSVLGSMRKYGQMNPVVVCRLAPDAHELLDGFKRLRAARSLGLMELRVRSLEVGIRAGKAAMLQLNRVGRNISTMEEALVVHSLCHEDGLSQVEVAVLLGRHKSWVSRRVSLIARLGEEVQERIRLGLLPASLGAELARLRRCNQHQVLEAITQHHLTWRETRQVIAALMQQPAWSHEAILRDPRQAVLDEGGGGVLAPEQESGLCPAAKVVLRKIVGFEKRCLEMALLLTGTDFAQFESKEEGRLREFCSRALTGLAVVEQELRKVVKGG